MRLLNSLMTIVEATVLAVENGLTLPKTIYRALFSTSQS